MDIRLEKSKINNLSEIAISGSKSETNRLLLLQGLFPQIVLKNASDADDSLVMKKALANDGDLIDVGHAGTTMRFLAAYFAMQENRTVTLTGSARMQQRPIGILVDALRQLGADIEYLKADGFPPLKITGKKMTKNKVTLRADVSSQFISALLLIAPKLENGLELALEGEITSRPYIEMTLGLLNQIGVKTSFESQVIRIGSAVKAATANHQSAILVESDWSSASYFYSIVALSEIGSEIKLTTFKEKSFQGDSALVNIYRIFGVETTFGPGAIRIRKTNDCRLSVVNFELQNNPDLAQTIAVTAFGLGVDCNLTGLHTLKIKETDRLLALKTELEKLGADVTITGNSISVKSQKISGDVVIKTYDDHRMAMAFAPLAIKVPTVIEDAEVVSKSYPAFWTDLQALGFTFTKS